MCVCVCVCMYACMHTYVHTYVCITHPLRAERIAAIRSVFHFFQLAKKSTYVSGATSSLGRASQLS